MLEMDMKEVFDFVGAKRRIRVPIYQGVKQRDKLEFETKV